MTALKQSTAQILCHVDRAAHALPCQLHFVFVTLQDSRGYSRLISPEMAGKDVVCLSCATHAVSELAVGDHGRARNEVKLRSNSCLLRDCQEAKGLLKGSQLSAERLQAPLTT